MNEQTLALSVRGVPGSVFSFRSHLGPFNVKENGTILVMCDFPFPRSAGCLFQVNLGPSSAVAPATCCKSQLAQNFTGLM